MQNHVNPCPSCSGTGTILGIRAYGACVTADGGPRRSECGRCGGDGVKRQAVAMYPAPDALELPPLTDAEMSAVLDATRARRRRAVAAGDVVTFRACTKVARAFAVELDARNALRVAS